MSRRIETVDQAAAGDVYAVVRAAFGARPPLDPPAGALAETVESIGKALADQGGLLALEDDKAVGSLLFDREGPTLALRRFGVVPGAQGSGVAGDLVRAAEEHAEALGCTSVRVVARVELPASVAFWEHNGFVRGAREGAFLHLVKVFPRRFTLPTAEDATAFGERIAGLMRAGDLVILTGELGAGKTTFTRGLGAGLEVRGGVTSPTFVIARVHPSLVGGPSLVHVDAYRLGSIDELDDLDLDTSLDEAVTVVEWGAGVAEGLADDRLEISLLRATGDVSSLEDHDVREAVVQPVGLRWADIAWPV
ncbi:MULTISPECIES: tRNA (adenosine(37)-N6)-threonylcarbamoyltransferase complex ATPase subunit type 1 TsaE [unclassified Nocardioides]|uniref:tRNA (adenosine(37)-N6)-threonylcarbamoyltransferase complex ATPase subunit type 1 TsaE n=1 Tax=unclassified Nocardioides TaxID=2615069 RepID=UPI0006F25798|nr:MULTISPECIES: tRNA (adenosine(37)-N6)-threonylcarbamoyltransferase complex ATPase subunit type 1 TsaE [unclassified Nocardioides]KQY56579.1 hypothetical protein ASD30_09635 [Nocardioides sp. Root140]KRF14412.1 hypothetical protein ASH02_08740 [Nocardioides sp. Soil796]